MPKKETKPTCMYTGCNRPVDSRGLCKRHIRQARSLIAKGETTFEALEKAKLCKPVERPARIDKTYFLPALVSGRAKSTPRRSVKK